MRETDAAEFLGKAKAEPGASGGSPGLDKIRSLLAGFVNGAPDLRQAAQSDLQSLATRQPEQFKAILKQAFGDKLGPEAAEALVRQAQAGELPMPAHVRFVDRETLQGANAAYSGQDGGTVYLSQDLVSDPAKLKAAFTEELGHHLDGTLGGADSTGDEGQVFQQALARGAPLGQQDLAAARADRDEGSIAVEGKQVEVEFQRKALPARLESVVRGFASRDAATRNEAMGTFRNLPPDEKRHVLERFATVHGADSSKTRGLITKLGMALGRGASELLNGMAGPFVSIFRKQLTVGMLMADTITNFVNNPYGGSFSIENQAFQFEQKLRESGIELGTIEAQKLYSQLLPDIRAQWSAQHVAAHFSGVGSVVTTGGEEATMLKHLEQAAKYGVLDQTLAALSSRGLLRKSLAEISDNYGPEVRKLVEQHAPAYRSFLP